MELNIRFNSLKFCLLISHKTSNCYLNVLSLRMCLLSLESQDKASSKEMALVQNESYILHGMLVRQTSLIYGI